jgi:hypothetical protein
MVKSPIGVHSLFLLGGCLKTLFCCAATLASPHLKAVYLSLRVSVVNFKIKKDKNKM